MKREREWERMERETEEKKRMGKERNSRRGGK